MSTYTSIVKPTSTELVNFYATLLKSKAKPVVLSIIPGYWGSYVPSQLTCVLPALLSDLNKEEYLDLLYPCIPSLCEKTFESLTIIPDQSKMIKSKN